MSSFEFKMNPQFLSRFEFKVVDAITEVAYNIEQKAIENAPASKVRTIGKRGRKVQVEINEHGGLEIAAGTHASASQSRAIKGKSVSQLQKKKGLNEFTYTFGGKSDAGWVAGRETLKKSSRVTSGDTGYTAYITFNVRYAKFVEEGTAKAGPQPYLLPALEEYRPIIESGEFLRKQGD